MHFHINNIITKVKQYKARKLIGFSEQQMYNVVADIKNYKAFLPFCIKSTILDHNDNILKANLEIGFPPVTENYTSKVTLVEPKLVKAQCYDGRLFNYLETKWKFAPGLRSNPKTCVIDFYVKFEFRSLLHSQLATIFFDKVVKEMEIAFINEARNRYGKESIPTHQLNKL